MEKRVFDGISTLEGAGFHFKMTESRTFWYNRNQRCHIHVMAVLRVAGVLPPAAHLKYIRQQPRR